MMGWRASAACLDADWQLFFDLKKPAPALAYCAACPVRADCRGLADRAEADNGSYVFGIFGGETPQARKKRRAGKVPARADAA